MYTQCVGVAVQVPVPVLAWRCLGGEIMTGLLPQLNVSQGHSDLSVWSLLCSQALTEGGKLCSLNAGLGRVEGVKEADKCDCNCYCSFFISGEVFLCCHLYV